MINNNIMAHIVEGGYNPTPITPNIQLLVTKHNREINFDLGVEGPIWVAQRAEKQSVSNSTNFRIIIGTIDKSEAQVTINEQNNGESAVIKVERLLKTEAVARLPATPDIQLLIAKHNDGINDKLKIHTVLWVAQEYTKKALVGATTYTILISNLDKA